MRCALTVLAAMLATSAALAADGLSVAREALRDGLWDVARAHAGNWAEAGTNEARLVVLESYAGEGKWDKVAECVQRWNDGKGDGFDYYRAVVRGDHSEAMAVLKRAGSPEGLIEVRLYEAEALAKAGRREDAEAAWREIAAKSNLTERVRATAVANLGDVTLMRQAYDEIDSIDLRRMVGLRLGRALLGGTNTLAEGEALIRGIVRDAPDADGAKTAYLSLADALVSNRNWKTANEVFHQAIETWPEVAKIAVVQEGRAWAMLNLGRREDAIEAFERAVELATDDESKARAMVEAADVLDSLGRGEEAMKRYREVLGKFPKTRVAGPLERLVKVRDLEAKGREAYRNFQFAEAMAVFGEVAKLDGRLKERMRYFSVLSLYGQGRDDEAMVAVRELADGASDGEAKALSTLWLAKFLYNRRDWKESARRFVAYAESGVKADEAAEAMLWAARATMSDNDYAKAVQLTTMVVEKYGEGKFRNRALILQGEALVELSRFDEAVLIFDRVSDGATAEERVKAKIRRADALYAMGADNPARYALALEAYRSVRFGGLLNATDQIVVAYKSARTLEKLKRLDEAMDQYYAHVVLAYRESRIGGTRLGDEAKAAFSRAAFRLADEYEHRGRVRQAVAVLELVVTSDVPAAGEAAKRIARIERKGANQ